MNYTLIVLLSLQGDSSVTDITYVQAHRPAWLFEWVQQDEIRPCVLAPDIIVLKCLTSPLRQ